MAVVDDRAMQLVLQGRVSKRADLDVFEVHGFSDRDYYVMVSGEDVIACTCPASKFDHETCYPKDGVRNYLEMRSITDFEDDGVEYGL